MRAPRKWLQRQRSRARSMEHQIERATREPEDATRRVADDERHLMGEREPRRDALRLTLRLTLVVEPFVVGPFIEPAHLDAVSAGDQTDDLREPRECLCPSGEAGGALFVEQQLHIVPSL